ncbi:NADPH:quinone oxidoreductase family protein [Chelatococcus sp. SYSU_G07232]|uniref:NADPH:quinone oxidoreductase family protein n=1 Tax=Chelatococcus albus TaxID=3047466 RepID=A0ABT7AK50_9HYPH|nr:NADPH:quinone oxidoreductase family protein [Chelatococcus sp. SYSU_G07232]MDJ1159755.1 NADPH:quinone oxidoreductase family protein [Chelatococcus sp. SYSU_G07232]
MKAILCKAFGPPESLVVEDLPEPVPGPGEVVVAVSAAALNFFDTLIIQGRYQYRPELPFSPGGELAGTVAVLGPDVTDWAVGERVMAYVGWGAGRERVVVKVQDLIRLPEALSDERAAGLTVTYGTSLHALQDRARLAPGETLAVLGAAGGAGLSAVELGRLMGARVIACASSADKLELALAHGADDTLDYGATDLKDGLRRLTGGRGVDVIYDPVGGALTEAALRAMAWEGRFLVVGFAGGNIPKLPLNLVLLKGCDVLGVFWGAFREREPAHHRANMARLVAWAAEGKLSAHVHAVYPLERTAEALDVIARREARGKVIVKP